MDKPADDMHLDGDALCDYAEGLAEGPARARAEIHLRGCAACRKEIEALRGYFLEMEGLEPAKAPADFLAKVHARLPKPSPWKKALSALSRPWRAIPVQIAFLTLLGVTGITAYLFQKGGLESEALPIAALDGTEPAGEAPGGEAPGGEAPGGETPGGETPDSDAPVAVAKVPDAKDSRAPVRKPPAATASRAISNTDRKGEGSPPEASAPPAQVDQAPAFAHRQAESGGGKLGPPQRREDGSRRISAISKAAKPRSAPEALSKRAPSQDADAYSERAGSAGVSNPGAEMLGDAAAPMEMRIRMAAMADSAAMLAGLRAMGTETSRQGSQSPEYILIMPASRLAETQAYLERYGSLQGADRMEPGSESSRIRILLRLLPPDP